MKDDLRYAPTDCSETIPFPRHWPTSTGLKEIGRSFYRLRSELMRENNQASFVINLMSPVVSPAIPMALPAAPERSDDPFERRVTRRLIEALEAARQATDDKTRGVSNAFAEAVSQVVSANLCEALAALAEALFKLDISVVWARTIPTDENRRVVRFSSPDSPILREASRIFRSREPARDVTLVGIVQQLTREQKESEGTVTLRASIEGTNQSVTAVLPLAGYDRAIHAHKTKAPVEMRGDLERTGQQWHLLNPLIRDVIVDDASERESNHIERAL